MNNTPGYSAILLMGLSAVLGCEDARSTFVDEEPRDADSAFHEVSSLTAEQAALAERYAPAAFSEGEIQLRRALDGGRGEHSVAMNEAQARFQQALSQADALRAEAKRAAEDNIEQARLLITIVEKIRSNDPPESVLLPDDNDLQECSETLQRAQAAYDEGNYVEAGLSAATVIERISRPATT